MTYATDRNEPEPTSEQPRTSTAPKGRWIRDIGIASLVLATGDFLVGGADRGPVAIATVLGLAVTSSVVFGGAFDLISAVLSRGRLRLVRWGVWQALTLAAFGYLSVLLDAPANFEGKYRTLAVGVFVACGMAGLSLGSVLMLFQPTRLRPSWLDSATLPRRAALTGALVCSAALCQWVDRTQFPGLYAPAHSALRLVATLLIGISIRLVVPVRPWPVISNRARMLAFLGVSSVASVPFFTLADPLNSLTPAILSRPLAATHLDALRDFSDFDLDGFSSLLGGGDCEPFRSSVSPMALDVPGNGVNEDCSRGDAKLMKFERLEPPLPSVPSPQNVVLITIDTLRPDRMSAYGYERETTPNIARWAAGATRFDEGYTSGGWTSIAIPSLFRGLYPRRLRWNKIVATNRMRYLRPPVKGKLKKGEAVRTYALLPMEDPRFTFPELLSRRGMHTIAVVNGGYTDILSSKWGTAVGFDEYNDLQRLPKKQRDDAEAASIAIDALRRHPAGQPFFLWIHFFGPHAPSKHHPGTREFGDTEPDKYDHQLAYTDAQVGRVLKELDAHQPEATTVFISADHGERFFNAKGRGHGADMGEDAIRIPLIVRGTGFPAGPKTGLVSLVDVMPTVLGLTETPAPPGLDGVDLRTVLGGGNPARTIFVDTFTRKDLQSFKLDLSAAMTGTQKVVRDRISRSTVLSVRTERTHPPRNLLVPSAPPPLLEALDLYIEDCGGSVHVVP